MLHKQWRFRSQGEFKRHRSNAEAQFQILLVRWLNSLGILSNASMAGGMNLGPRIGALKKKMGVKSGYPDLEILEPRGKFHGMFLELKVAGGKVTPEQTEWQKALTERGYHSVIMPCDMEIEEGLAWIQQKVEEYLQLC